MSIDAIEGRTLRTQMTDNMMMILEVNDDVNMMFMIMSMSSLSIVLLKILSMVLSCQ